jgi:hypothetical protein
VSPNAPSTPARNIRIPDPLWTDAKDKAASEGTTVSDVVREKLTEYVEEDGDE